MAITWATASTAQPSAATVIIRRPLVDARFSQQAPNSHRDCASVWAFVPMMLNARGEHSEGAGAARLPGSIAPKLEPNPKRREEGGEGQQERAKNPEQALVHDEFARQFIESRAMCRLDANGQARMRCP